MLTGKTSDNREFSFFDTHYYLHKQAYRIGESYSFRLAALAYKAEILPEDERSITMTVDETVRMAEASGEELNRDENGEVIPNELLMDNLVACLNHIDELPDMYNFQSPVFKCRTTKVLGTPMYCMDICIARNEDGEDLVKIPLYAKKAYFAEKPKKDSPVRGWLWLFGKKV